jgi:hypothetical protein
MEKRRKGEGGCVEFQQVLMMICISKLSVSVSGTVEKIHTSTKASKFASPRFLPHVFRGKQLPDRCGDVSETAVP